MKKLLPVLFCLIGCHTTPTQPTDPSPTPNPTTPCPTAEPSPSPAPTPKPSPSTFYKGDAMFKPFVEAFVADGIIQGTGPLNTRNPDLEVSLGDLSQYGQGVIGLCEVSESLRRVTFNSTFWKNVDDGQRQLLAHHEFGHCVLYRPHRTDSFDDGTPESIMYPVIMSNAVYNNAHEHYQNELFTWKGIIDGYKTFICNGE